MTPKSVNKSRRLKARVPKPQTTLAPSGILEKKIIPSRPGIPTLTMRLDRIRMGIRFRKDLGDIQTLARSIEEIGLEHPVVVTPNDDLIAGQRRIAAFRMLKRTHIPVTVVNLERIARGELHENGIRKNLTPSEIVAVQRAIETSERREARLRQGYRSDIKPPATVAGSQVLSFGDSRDKVAQFCGKGRTTIARAAAVVDAAEKAPEEYGHLVARMDQTGNVAAAYRRMEKLRQVKELENSPSKLPAGKFNVIVADPPWQYESDGLAYPTMSLEQIKAMRVVDIADENAILWLWVTNAHHRVAFEVVDSWGFECKTMLTWNKMSMGTGEWLRGQTEHCLLAVRGKPLFLNGKYSTYLEAKRREHSRKPEEFYQLVEATCPGRKLELFARQKRVGWEAYGNDINKFSE